jgi:hypothetical protein
MAEAFGVVPPDDGQYKSKHGLDFNKIIGITKCCSGGLRKIKYKFSL